MKERRKLLYLVILALAISACTALASRGWLGSLLRPLPFTGPYEGLVLDLVTNEPIADAAVEGEWWCHDNPLPDQPGQFSWKH